MTQGFYIIPHNPDLPRGVRHKYLAVDPYRVLVRNKQHYRLYTCEIHGVTVLKQMSYPSVEELLTGLNQAINSKGLRVTTDIRKLITESKARTPKPEYHRTKHLNPHTKPGLQKKGGRK